MGEALVAGWPTPPLGPGEPRTHPRWSVRAPFPGLPSWRVTRSGRAFPAEAETPRAETEAPAACVQRDGLGLTRSRRGCYAVGHSSGSGGDGTVFHKRVAPERARSPPSGPPG